MVDEQVPKLLCILARWLESEASIRSAVLFGSHARPRLHPAAADPWSDIDLHLITDDPQGILAMDWPARLPELEIELTVARAATGGVSKLSLLTTIGEADLVLVPTRRMRLANLITQLGLQRMFPHLDGALNSFATVMSGGYRFLKGESSWGKFYANTVARQPGFRISDRQARRMAEDYLYDLLWIIKKLKRGELVAAQRTFHRSLLETNIALLHELRLRQGRTTFQQARRVEKLLSPEELQTVAVNASLDGESLRRALKINLEGLKSLMGQLTPTWKIPERVSHLLNGEFSPTAR